MNPVIYQVVSAGDKASPRWEIHIHQNGSSSPTGYHADSEGGAIRLAALLQACAACGA